MHGTVNVKLAMLLYDSFLV